MKTIDDKIQALIALKKRNDMILKMRKAGYTYKKIAEYFGISKQRVYQIISEIEQQEKAIFIDEGEKDG